ncbi:MAG TPA: heme-binding protein [Nevskiaceae bacterium]
MKTKPALVAEDVQLIIKNARRFADDKGYRVSISVVDDGGNMLGMIRLDGAAPLTAAISRNKARTAALSRKESRAHEESINGGRYALLSAPLKAMMEGGVPVMVGGEVAGAVGVSGVKSAQDAEIAKAGIRGLDLDGAEA